MSRAECIKMYILEPRAVISEGERDFYSVELQGFIVEKDTVKAVFNIYWGQKMRQVEIDLSKYVGDSDTQG